MSDGNLVVSSDGNGQKAHVSLIPISSQHTNVVGLFATASIPHFMGNFDYKSLGGNPKKEVSQFKLAIKDYQHPNQFVA